MHLPILYSYRRCPYAMRARMALHYAGIACETREIDLKHKPEHMRTISPKATVPVLMLNDGKVLEQSLDIMHWALQQRDTDGWLNASAPGEQLLDNDSGSLDNLSLDNHSLQNPLQQDMAALIARNDGAFKQALDRYKYASRFPEQSPEDYRSQGEVFLRELEGRLSQHAYLCGNTCSMADIAIFPFIRQFAAVDSAWFNGTRFNATRFDDMEVEGTEFDDAPYPRLQHWLARWVQSELFLAIMKKHPVWLD